MYPTLVEQCKLPRPSQKLEGRSLVSILADPSTAQHRKVYLPYTEPSAYAVIDRQWRYIHYAGDTEELYDLRNDPNEWHNLAGKPESAAVIERMKVVAPKTFAKPAFKLNKHKHLILEGDAFHWEVLTKK